MFPGESEILFRPGVEFEVVSFIAKPKPDDKPEEPRHFEFYLRAKPVTDSDRLAADYMKATERFRTSSGAKTETE